jgi:hypothetical protein
LFILSLRYRAYCVLLTKLYPMLICSRVFLTPSCSCFRVLGLILMSLIHLELIFETIAEILHPKGLSKRMNRQQTNREDQKIDDQLANFYFCIRLISSTNQKVIQCKKNFYAWETMPSHQPPWFHKQNPDLSSLPSFIYTKPGPWLPRTCCPVPNFSVLLILNKYLQVINVSILQTKEATAHSLKNSSERCGTPAVSDLVWTLLSHKDLVRLWHVS